MLRQTRYLFALLCATCVVGTLHAAVDEENLEEYGRGIISDYSNMSPMGEIEYAWVKPGTSLNDYKFKVAPIENLTVIVDEGMEDTFKTLFPKQLNRGGSRDANAPVLDVKGAIYWVERANAAKAWIPFGGMHMAQSGVGIELVFSNAAGEVVAKIRQSGREGRELKDSALGLSDDIARFVRGH